MKTTEIQVRKCMRNVKTFKIKNMESKEDLVNQIENCLQSGFHGVRCLLWKEYGGKFV